MTRTISKIVIHADDGEHFLEFSPPLDLGALDPASLGALVKDAAEYPEGYTLCVQDGPASTEGMSFDVEAALDRQSFFSAPK